MIIYFVVGLIEERDLNYNKYINIVPGWEGVMYRLSF